MANSSDYEWTSASQWADDVQENWPKVSQIIADHYKNNLDTAAPVTIPKSQKPGEIAKLFDSRLSENGVPLDNILEVVKSKVFKNCTHWQHPNFLAFFPGNTPPTAGMAEALISSIGAVGLQWASNPVAIELEVVVMDWLAAALGLSEEFFHTSGKGGGLIQCVAGEALLSAVMSARIKKIRELEQGNTIDHDALFYHPMTGKLVIYTSSDVHFSTLKACRYSGVRCRKIQSEFMTETQNYGIRATAIATAIEEDVKNGLVPCGIFLTYGTTNTCGMDEIAPVKSLAEKYNLWVHVDAAYAGVTLMLPECQTQHGFTVPISKQLSETVTSINANGSKWMPMGFHSAFFWCKDRQLLVDANAYTANFMVQTEGADDSMSPEQIYAPEFKDWSVFLGRPFRSLRLFMIMKQFGLKGLQNNVRKGIYLTNRLAALVKRFPGDYVVPVSHGLGLLVFFLTPKTHKKSGDKVSRAEINKRLVAFLNNEKQFYLLTSKLEGKYVIRVSMGSMLADNSHVDNLFEAMREFQSLYE